MTRSKLVALSAAWMVTCALACGPGTAEDDSDAVVIAADDGKADALGGSDGRTYHVRRDPSHVARKLRVDEAAAPGPAVDDGIDPGAIAQRFLRRNAALFQLDPTLGDLRVDGVSADGVVDLGQLIHGRPLFGAGVRVDVDASGAVASVHNRTVSGLAVPTVAITVSENDASAAAGRAGISADQRELGWVIGRDGKLLAVWRVGGRDGQVLVDGVTGRVVFHDDSRRDVTGHGSVYSQSSWVDPHPIEVPLSDVSSDGTLTGPRVVVAAPRGDAASGKATHYLFDFPPGSPRFGQVMVYHHLDGAVRWLAGLGFHPRKKAITVHTGAFADLNAYFDARADAIFMGATPDFDTTTDAGVFVHEYGHAVVNAYAPGLFGSGPAAPGDAALHEGFADFLACVYFNDPRSAEALHLAIYKLGLGADYLRKIGSDGRHPGRRCDSDHRYPGDLDADPHVAGMIVSGSLWDLRAALTRAHGAAGTKTAHLLAFGALAHLARANNDLVDVLEAVLEADRRLGGKNAAAIRAAFSAHGVTLSAALDPSAGLPWLPVFAAGY